MPTFTTERNVIAVFTGKSFEHILDDGGSQSWALSRNNARHCEYLVCCRSSVNWVEGPEPHGSAFLVGRISDVVPSTETEDRWKIKISEFAKVNIPDVWKGWRNPVRYTDFASLGIDVTTLAFEPVPKVNTAEVKTPGPQEKAKATPLTISEAKRGLALSLGIAEDAIEIRICG